MKKIMKRTVLTVIMGTNIFCSTYGQQREVTYVTSTNTLFAIPKCIDLKKLTSLDLEQLISREATLQLSKFEIDADNALTITTQYRQTPRYENDYENMVGKVVTDMHGTTLFDHKGEPISYEEDLDENLVLPAEIADDYGVFNALFEIDRVFIFSMLEKTGFKPFWIGNKLFALNEKQEIMADFDRLTYENRIFNEQGTLEDLVWTQYEFLEDYIIPSMEVSISYNILPSGIQYQKTDIKSYLSYEVLVDKKPLVMKLDSSEVWLNGKRAVAGGRFEQFDEIKRREAALRLYPNPASEQISITLPFYMSNNVTVSITNTLGVKMISQQYSEKKEINVDISQLPAGVYFVRCETNNQVETSRFVKL